MKRLIAPLIGLLAALHGPARGQDSPQLQLPRVTLSAGMHLIQAQVASTPEQRASDAAKAQEAADQADAAAPVAPSTPAKPAEVH